MIDRIRDLLIRLPEPERFDQCFVWNLGSMTVTMEIVDDPIDKVVRLEVRP